MLQWCKSQVDRLIVGVASDEYCNAHSPAMNTWRDRADVDKAIRYADSAFCYYSHDFMSRWRETEGIDVMFLSTEIKDGIERMRSVHELSKHARIVWVPRTPGISSTECKERIVRQ